MAATKGNVGLGTTIGIGDGASPEQFTDILEPKDLTGPAMSQEYADMTHMQSPNGFRERKPTFKTSGEVTFKVNYVATDLTHQQLIDDAIAQTLRNFKIQGPDNSVFIFAAYIGLAWSYPMANAIEMTVTLTVTGSVDATTGSPA